MKIDISPIEQYIKFCADQLLVSYGCDKKYNIDNPFTNNQLLNKNNFFEQQDNNSYKSIVK